MSAPISNAAQSLLTSKVMRFCSCWDIECTDGTDIHVTDHDHAVEFNGVSYTPAGFNPSARQRQANVKENNMELRGVIDSTLITHEALRGGRFREAKITEWTVDWMYPWAGALLKSVFWVKSTSFDGETWSAQLVDLPGTLLREQGTVYSRLCRRTLGNASCAVVLGDYTDNATVTSIIKARKKFSTNLSGSTADNLYNYGVVTWLTGLNAGLIHEVHANIENRIALQWESPYEIQVGDTLTVSQGCDHRKSTCADKFNNFINFGGFPHIPGTQKVLKTPAQR